jgi:uncharacterized protein
VTNEAAPVHAITLTTQDGVVLDARLHAPSGPPVGGIVMSHPHPLYGGDQHHPLVVAICEAMSAIGWLAVRFDFRGTNSSGGSHGRGVDEQLDVLAAVADLRSRLPNEAPLVAAGYSFGAATTFRTHDDKLSARIGIALPVSMLQEFPTPLPTLLIHPRHDQYTSVMELEAAATSWPGSTVPIDILEGADHFMNGFVQAVVTRVIDFCQPLSAE